MVRTVLLVGLDRRRTADCGVGTQEVATGAEAIARLSERDFDAIAIGDVPDASLAELITRVGALRPSLPVVVCADSVAGARIWEQVPSKDAADRIADVLRRAAEVGWLRREHDRFAQAAPSSLAPEVVRTFERGSVREMERLMIRDRLARLSQNRTRSAESLAISVRTLRNKLREYRERAAQVQFLQGSALTD